MKGIRKCKEEVNNLIKVIVCKEDSLRHEKAKDILLSLRALPTARGAQGTEMLKGQKGLRKNIMDQ